MRYWMRWLAVLTVLLAAAPAAGQSRTVTPERGSALRRDLMDALRVPVQRELGKPVIFEVTVLRVRDGWAFMQGMPRAPGGGELDYRGTPYQEDIEAGVFDDGICALLRLRNGRWTVVTHSIGATDVPWVEWAEHYGAPASIFPG